MIKAINFKKLLISILIPQVAGALAYLISSNTMDVYNEAVKPPLSLDVNLFNVIWVIMYLFAGIAAYIIMDSGESIKHAKYYYYIQLIASALWIIIFFKAHIFSLAAVWAAVMLALALAAWYLFRKISESAANILTPYVIWLLYIAYLSIGIFILNH